MNAGLFFEDMMAEDTIILHLSLVDGISDGTIVHLLKQMRENHIELSELYQMNSSQVMRYGHISAIRAEAIVQGLADQTALEKELHLLEMHHCEYVSIADEQYPTYLREIHCPPAVLYWQGKPLGKDERCVAVIGSRHANYYGLAAIEKLVPPLVEYGWTIVSGGAIGADSKAHEVALACGGRTIAVLGTGLLKPYPLSNKKLFERMIMQGGTICSPFPLMMEAVPGNFPARNRIIAGLSRGCLVAQAAAKSGTHITAQFALEQGRDLFAVPGPIDDPLSAGCHSLIQQGATLVHSVQDILQELEPMGVQLTMPLNQVQPAAENCVSVDNDGPDGLIVRLCIRPCTIDELAQQTGLSVQDLYSRLFTLELAGKVCRQLNGTWERG